MVDEAKWVRQELGRRVAACVRESIGYFGARWGRGEGGRLRGSLRGFGGGNVG